MRAHAVIRVFCQDGPFRGVRYLDPDTGRVLFVDASLAARVVYELVDTAVSVPASVQQARLAQHDDDQSQDQDLAS